MLFDTHAHIDDHAFDEDREQVIDDFHNHNIALIMNPGCSLQTSVKAHQLSLQYDFIYAAVGSHPDSADEINENVIQQYRNLCHLNPKIKAIGEIGLDYHYEDVPRQIQQRAFRMQLSLARELNLPVIVHEREAHEDGMRIIDEFPEVKGVFHCYSGAADMAKALVKRGWYIGFTGVLTFKNAKKAIDAASSISLDHIVIETDSPYMAPVPFRGSRNDPRYLCKIAEKLAEIRGISIEEVQRITLNNGKRLYHIDI